MAYIGEVLDAEVIEQRYPGDTIGVYCLALSSSLVIVSLVCGVGASANAPPLNVRANARFVLNPGSRSARIEVTRPIEAGGEIFVSYGAEYWKNARSSFHSTSDVPDWEWDLSDPFASSSIPPCSSCLPSSFISPSIVDFDPVVFSGPAVRAPVLGPVRLPPPEEVFPPPLSACEVHVGPAVLGCFDCIPGLFVCPAHFSPCGGLSLLCCNFCLKALCLKHFYCPRQLRLVFVKAQSLVVYLLLVLTL